MVKKVVLLVVVSLILISQNFEIKVSLADVSRFTSMVTGMGITVMVLTIILEGRRLYLERRAAFRARAIAFAEYDVRRVIDGKYLFQSKVDELETRSKVSRFAVSEEHAQEAAAVRSAKWKDWAERNDLIVKIAS